MLVSTICFKVAISALIALTALSLLDHVNGTGEPWQKSPMWIAVPGTLAALTLVFAALVASIAFVWGL